MPMPTGRNRTYVDGSAVVPADLNDIQDQIIAGNAPWLSVSPIGPALAGAIFVDAGFVRPNTSVFTQWYVPVSIMNGATIDEVAVRLDRGGAGTISVTFRHHLGTSGASLHSFNVSAGTGWTNLTQVLVAPVQVGLDGSMYIRLEADNVANKIAGMRMHYALGPV